MKYKCKICEAFVNANQRREHLENHNPNAANMETADILNEYEAYH